MGVRMKKYVHTLLSATALVASLAGPTMAADAAAPQGDQLYTAENPFAGFYIGVHAGGSSSVTDNTYVEHNVAGSDTDGNWDYIWGQTDGEFSQDASGYLAGVQAGANVVANGFLIGGEVRASLSSESSGVLESDDCIDGDFLCDGAFDPTDFYLVRDYSIDSVVLAQGKLGFATEQFAAYATAGLAMGHINLHSAYVLDTSDSWIGHFQSDFDTSEWVAGYTVGVGAEVALADGVTAGLSYNYIDYGTVETEGSVDFTAQEGTGTGYANRSDDITQQVVTIQLNKYF